MVGVVGILLPSIDRYHQNVLYNSKWISVLYTPLTGFRNSADCQDSFTRLGPQVDKL